MGYNEEKINSLIGLVRKEFTPIYAQLISSKLALQNSPRTFFKEVQNNISLLLLHQLGLDAATQFRFLLFQNKVQFFEEAIEVKHQNALEIFKRKNADNAPDNIILFEPRSNASSLIEIFFHEELIKKGLENLSKASENEFNHFLDNIDKLVVKLLKTNPNDTILAQYKEQTYANEWFINNAKYTAFHFNQSNWGSNYVLDQGLCMAINYRWIKEILKHPDKKITSLTDVDPAVKTELKNYIPITPQDRKNQAEYILGIWKNIHGYLNIPPKMLKKDGITETQLFEDHTLISTVKELIDFLYWAIPGEKNIPIGVIGVILHHLTYDNTGKISKRGEGHVITLLINQTKGFYCFFDSNSGFYPYYPSLKEFTASLDSYLKVFYKGIYNSFTSLKYESATQ